MFAARSIDEEKVVGAGPAGNVDIFPQLDIAFGAENHEAPVSPGRQRIGREPIDADIAEPRAAAQIDFAKIFESGYSGWAILVARALVIVAEVEPVK